MKKKKTPIHFLFKWMEFQWINSQIVWCTDTQHTRVYSIFIDWMRVSVVDCGALALWCVCTIDAKFYYFTIDSVTSIGLTLLIKWMNRKKVFSNDKKRIDIIKKETESERSNFHWISMQWRCGEPAEIECITATTQNVYMCNLCTSRNQQMNHFCRQFFSI